MSIVFNENERISVRNFNLEIQILKLVWALRVLFEFVSNRLNQTLVLKHV